MNQIPKLGSSETETPSPRAVNERLSPEIEQKVNASIKHVLSKNPQEKDEKGWNWDIFSWFNYSPNKELPSENEEEGKKETEEKDIPVNEFKPISENTRPIRESTIDYSQSHTILPVGSEIDDPYADLPDLIPLEKSTVEERTVPQGEPRGAELTPALTIETTIDKTNQAAEKSFLGKLWDATITQGSALLFKGIPLIFNLDRKKAKNIIFEQKKEMIAQLDDPIFVEFYEVVSAQILIPLIKENLPENAKNEDFDLILEVILARGFSHLAKQMKQNEKEIPNFSKQPSLVSLLSLICQKTGKHFDQESFNKIERKYPSDLKLSDEELQKKKKELLDLFSQASEDILLCLFPNKLSDAIDIAGLSGTTFNLIKNTSLTAKLEDYLFNTLKTTIADQLLTIYSPMGEFASRKANIETEFKKQIGVDLKPLIDAPSALFVALGKNYIQSDPTVVENVADFIDSIVNPSPLIPIRKQILQIKEKIPAPRYSLDPVMGEGMILEELETELEKIDKTNQNLQELRGKKDRLKNIKTPEVKEALNELNQKIDELIALKSNRFKKKKNIIEKASQTQLATWIVESMQTMLNQEDANFKGLFKFINQSANNISLSLLSKGSKLISPEEKTTDSKIFLKQLSDRLIEKIQEVQEEEDIPPSLLEEFFDDIPLPSVAKDFLISKLIEKSADLHAAFDEIKNIHDDAFEKIKTYKGSDEFLSISNKIADQLLDTGVHQNIELVDTYGFKDTIDELFNQYLPGITINKDLKAWFKGNISNLGSPIEETDAKLISLTKKGLQAIILKGMINTIEKNFKGEDYAAQLLTNIQKSCSKAFESFDDTQRNQLDKALDIQKLIDEKNERIEKIKKDITIKPDLLNEEAAFFEDYIAAESRFTKAKNDVNQLEEKRNQLLNRLNEEQDKKDWLEEDLSLVSEALSLRKNEMSSYLNPSDYYTKLRVTTQVLEDLEKVSALTGEKKRELEQRKILQILINIKPSALKTLSEAIAVHHTIGHSKKQMRYFEKELEAKAQVIEEYDAAGKMKSPKVWKDARMWLQNYLENKEEVQDLQNEINFFESYLDSQLGVFQNLSKGFIALLGLDDKEKLDLPPNLQDQIWPMIKSFEEKQFARMLFAQISPLYVCLTDAKKNKDRLDELSKNNPFFTKIIRVAAEEVVGKIPEFFTSYKPFSKQILNLFGEPNPSDKQIVDLESEISKRLIILGKEGTQPSMLKDLIKVEKDFDITASEKIGKLIPKWKPEHPPFKEIQEILKTGKTIKNKREQEALNKQTETLIHSLNQFLFQRGKMKFGINDILSAYEAISHLKLSSEKKKEFSDLLSKTQIVGNLQKVIISPEEIALALNAIIPGATEFETLIAPQIQEVIVGEAKPFKENRDILQKFIEGALLKFFVKIGEANQGIDLENPMAIITEKLKKLSINAVPKIGQSAEEAAREMIDDVLMDICDFYSKEDLTILPASLKELAFEKIKEQAYHQLTPLILPMIERNQNRALLETLSGSPVLGNLCKALSRDVFGILPSAIKSYHPIAKEILILFDKEKIPSDEQVEMFSIEIANLVKEKKVKDHLLIETYEKITKKSLSEIEKKQLRILLEERKVKAEIKNIIVTPQEIASMVGTFAPHLDEETKILFAKEMEVFFQNKSETSMNASDFIGAYLEGVFLNIFIQIAEKNPKEVSGDPSIPSKDSLVVITEKLLEVVSKEYSEAKAAKNFDLIGEKLTNPIVKDILGWESPSSLKGVPSPIQKIVYDKVKGQLTGIVSGLQTKLAAEQNSQKEMIERKEAIKKFGIDDLSGKGVLQVLAEDISNMVVQAIPHTLAENTGEHLKGVLTISKSVESYLESLAKNDMQLAKELLNYTHTDQFENILSDALTKIADPESLKADKKKIAELVSNILIQPLSTVIENTLHFEEEHQKEFNRELMTSVLHIAAQHIKHLNDARAMAASEGRKDIQYHDFLNVVGGEIHPAVPTKEINYERTIQSISNRLGFMPESEKKEWEAKGLPALKRIISESIKKEAQGDENIHVDLFFKQIDTLYNLIIKKPLLIDQINNLRGKDDEGNTLRDLMRQEAEASTKQREHGFYDPATKKLLKLLFPNGKDDLAFVPEELRDTVWGQFKTNLFPIVIPMLVETVLEPSMINKIVLNSLENLRSALEVEPSMIEEPVEDPSMDHLDDVAGELLGEMLRATILPEWSKKLLLNPKTGEFNIALKRTMGAVLRNQFNDTFIKEKLNTALQSAISRNDGVPNLAFDARPKEVIAAEASVKAQQMEKDLKNAFRGTLDASISYIVKTYWYTAHAWFEKILDKYLGPHAVSIKQYFDQIFALIYFKILAALLYPIKMAVREVVYLYLDQNRKSILELFTTVPTDQSEFGEKKYALFHEDLVYKIGEAVQETVEKFLDAPS